MPSAEAGPAGGGPGVVVCVDLGSTFTKGLLVDLATGDVAAVASSRTTVGTDVMDGFDAVVDALAAADPRTSRALRSGAVRACSSAGGGLRIAVVGNEALVTAEAGRRVALSSGGKVVAVLALSEDARGEDLADARPDVVLLVGGTDGGNPAALRQGAALVAGAAWEGPVVVAGNVEVRDEVVAGLTAAGHACVAADNVVPRIGVLAPTGARTAVREVFLAHVIGGKGLSSRPDFTALVRGATPDVVLTGVELAARGTAEDAGAGDLVVVDVGGATTDVHSVVEIDPDSTGGGEANGGLSREVVAPTPLTRTVEGDLGMRWSAPDTVVAAGLADDAGLVAAAAARRSEPGLLPAEGPAGESERAVDERLAAAAAGLALRRHAGRSRVFTGPDGRVVERSGTDLREVRVLVASGGVFRHGRPGVETRVLADSTGEAGAEGGWQLPQRPRVVVDSDSRLAAVGLLAADHPAAALRLARGLVGPPPGSAGAGDRPDRE
ncbi:methylaspartate mutase accessory protein GlmL [Nocardioides lentus]|uniref:Methylaspartate mutase accessory protein GlmL n=1 Tax=Nocardioides lentus TaxID=338077 RepID=A0ABP5AMQ5_9ACTN